MDEASKLAFEDRANQRRVDEDFVRKKSSWND